MVWIHFYSISLNVSDIFALRLVDKSFRNFFDFKRIKKVIMSNLEDITEKIDQLDFTMISKYLQDCDAVLSGSYILW